MATTEESGTNGVAMADETAFQRDLLATIARLGSAKGLAIKRTLEEEYGDINHGRLYPNLDTLVERGLVEKGTIDRRTNSYELTESGRRALEDHHNWHEGALEV